MRGWQAAYRGLMPAAFLDGLDLVARTAMWTRWLASPNPSSVILVGEMEDRVAGFAIAGAPGGDSPSDEGSDHNDSRGELWSLYVHPEAWGEGVGGMLLGAAEQAMLTDGFRSAGLWVVVGNARARRFYEAHGWCADGTVRVEQVGPADDLFDVSEVRYVRML